MARGVQNVAASEVEAVLLQHPQVFDCAVLGVPDPLCDEAIKACVVLHLSAQVSAKALIAWWGTCKSTCCAGKWPNNHKHQRTHGTSARAS